MAHTIGVVLAGGTGSRLLPLTRTINKHLLPVNGQPMLHWPIRTLALAGIERVVVVLGGKSAGEVVEHFGSEYVVEGRTVRLAYVYQREAGGIGQALAVSLPLVEELGADRVRVILGDNVFPGGEAGERPTFDSPNAVVVGVDVPDAEWKYGCVDVPADRREGTGRAFGMPVEKPGTSPPAGRRWLALSGVYDFPMFLGKGRLAETVARLARSARGEVEITFLLERFWNYGLLSITEHAGLWIDAGEPEGYRMANDPSFWSGVTGAA